MDYLRVNVSPEDNLKYHLSQDGCPLERYGEDFLVLSRECLCPEFRDRPVVELINLIRILLGAQPRLGKTIPDEIDHHPVPSGHMASNQTHLAISPKSFTGDRARRNPGSVNPAPSQRPEQV
ncbi:hypothetical protein E1301_Tti013028 [Triplophysa tibetana]|uniref:Uncharacterized protein n=1 Tax=Triplophysa tibetana TaxID=1572043 RepID=A0A5A9NNT8_9TELE|nr:hypothetical protein E1301_Tti013028 [Triplophysa tibetana]